MLEYDNVVDKQRRAMYARRTAMLTGTLDEVENVIKELAQESEAALVLLSKKEEELGREALELEMRIVCSERSVPRVHDDARIEHALLDRENMREYGLPEYQDGEDIMPYMRKALEDAKLYVFPPEQSYGERAAREYYGW